MLEETIRFFGLSEDCFQINLDTKYFYESRQHREAFVRMKYSIDTKYPFYLLSGYPGSGKTIITQLVKQRYTDFSKDSTYKCIYIDSALKSYIPLFKVIISKLTGKAVPTNDEYLLYTLYRDTILKLRESNIYVILFLDEAHNYSKKTLEYIRQLTNITEVSSNYITICLVGQPELHDNIVKLKQLDQRILVRYLLSPLDITSTEEYIYFRLAKADCRLKIFTPGAIEYIYQSSNGIPREINSCCNQCLDSASLKGIKRIDKDLSEGALKHITKHNADEEEKLIK